MPPFAKNKKGRYRDGKDKAVANIDPLVFDVQKWGTRPRGADNIIIEFYFIIASKRKNVNRFLRFFQKKYEKSVKNIIFRRA